MSRSRTPLAVASAVNLLANLLFPALAIRALGIGPAADALFMVFILPGVVVVLLGNSVLNWATPRLVRRSDPASRRQLAWSLLWILLGGVGALCVLLSLPAWLLRPGLAAGSSYALAIDALPAGCVAMLAATGAAVGQALHTAGRAVLESELRTLVANAVILAVWFAVDPSTLAACAWLFALRGVLHAGVLLPRLGMPRPADLSDRDLREVLRDSRLLLLAATYYKSEPFVDRLLFASVSGGAAAAFHLAHQLLATVTLLMNRVITAPMVAPLAERVHAGDGAGARRVLARALWRMALTGVLVWLLFAVAGEPLVRLLFLDAVPEAAHVALTAQLLVLLGGYMLAILLGQTLAQAYYTTGHTRAVMWLGIAGFTLGLAIKALALWYFGAAGLAAALSVSWLLNVSLYGLFRPAIFRRRPAPAG
ncbi:MAG: lipid II flippase MurJ [Pseudomonadota bacterium]